MKKAAYLAENRFRETGQQQEYAAGRIKRRPKDNLPRAECAVVIADAIGERPGSVPRIRSRRGHETEIAPYGMLHFIETQEVPVR